MIAVSIIAYFYFLPSERSGRMARIGNKFTATLAWWSCLKVSSFPATFGGILSSSCSTSIPEFFRGQHYDSIHTSHRSFFWHVILFGESTGIHSRLQTIP